MISWLEAGLKAAGLRGRVLANNIANLNTPGYRRKVVEFEKLLTKALGGGDPGAVAAKLVQAQDTPVKPNGNDVDLDVEVGALIKNSALFKTYMRVLAKRYQQMELAMRQQL